MGNKTNPKKVSWRGYSYDQNSFTGAIDGGWQGFLSTYTNDRVGSHDPSFRVKIKQNQNASGPMSVTVQNAGTSDADCVIYWRKAASGPDSRTIYTSGHNGVFFGLNVPIGITGHWASNDLDKACSVAVRAFQQQWTRRRRAVMGIAMAGELGKTIDMLIRPAKGLQNAVKTYIARAKKLAKRTTRGHNVVKVIADTYLEATFGWKPLIGDIRDGAKALARVATKDALERHQFRSFGEYPKPFSQTTGILGPIGFSPISGVTYALERTQSMNSICIIYGVWSTRLQDSALTKTLAERLIQRSGFSFEDWAPSAWELIPWSFFVDYFSNIGDVIEASCNTLDGPLWVEEVDITSSFDHRRLKPLPDNPKANFGARFVMLDGAELFTWSELKTVVRKGFDMAKIRPTLSFQLPVDMQWLNIAALAAGARPPKPFY